MFDRANEVSFTKSEAMSFVGRTVRTTGGTATIKSVCCDGPNSYLLVDERGYFVYKSHNNCPYVI